MFSALAATAVAGKAGLGGATPRQNTHRGKFNVHVLEIQLYSLHELITKSTKCLLDMLNSACTN